MKKQKLGRTFAQAAKAITNKYRRRLGDDLSNYDRMSLEAMNKELEQLAAKQEEFKAKQMAKTQGQYQEMAYGGSLPQYGGVTNTTGVLPPKTPRYAAFEDTNPMNYYPTAYDMSSYGPENEQYKRERDFFKPIDYNKSVASNKGSSWWGGIPMESKVGAGIQGLTAAAQMALAFGNKPKKVTYNPTAVPDPKLVDDTEAYHRAQLGFANQQANSRYLSPSQYMSQMQALARGEAQTTAGIAENTANANADILNKHGIQKAEFSQRDEQMRNRMEMYNNEQDNQYMQNLSTGIGNLGAVGAGFAKDVGSQKMQSAMMQFMNQSNYGSRVINGYPVQTNKLGNLETYTDPRTGAQVYEELGNPIDKATFLRKVAEHYKRLNP